jgi:hypothetical protein
MVGSPVGLDLHQCPPRQFPHSDAMKRAASIGLATLIVFSTTLPCAALAAQHARAAPAPSAGAEVASPKIRELLTLLGDPGVQAWLQQQNDAKSSAASGQNIAEESVSQVLDARLAAIREHIVALGRTVPDLPNQFWRGGQTESKGKA